MRPFLLLSSARISVFTPRLHKSEIIIETAVVAQIKYLHVSKRDLHESWQWKPVRPGSSRRAAWAVRSNTAAFKTVMPELHAMRSG